MRTARRPDRRHGGRLQRRGQTHSNHLGEHPELHGRAGRSDRPDGEARRHQTGRIECLHLPLSHVHGQGRRQGGGRSGTNRGRAP